LSEKLDHALNIQNTGGVGSDGIYLELEKENDFVKIKIQKLEQDCFELTEENLDLIYKLKEVGWTDRKFVFLIVKRCLMWMTFLRYQHLLPFLPKLIERSAQPVERMMFLGMHW
jgi:hypothetical protein